MKNEAKDINLLEIEIYTRTNIIKNEFGGQMRKMYRIAFYENKWRFVWIPKDLYNKLETGINKYGELFKRYTGPVRYENGSLYIDMTPEVAESVGHLSPTRKGIRMDKV